MLKLLICKQTDYWKQEGMELATYARMPYVKAYIIKGECMFRLYLSETGCPAMDILKSKYGLSLSDEYLNDCMRVVIIKYIPNYTKPAEGI
jgi:hypothetical protein